MEKRRDSMVRKNGRIYKAIWMQTDNEHEQPPSCYLLQNFVKKLIFFLSIQLTCDNLRTTNEKSLDTRSRVHGKWMCSRRKQKNKLKKSKCFCNWVENESFAVLVGFYFCSLHFRQKGISKAAYALAMRLQL